MLKLCHRALLCSVASNSLQRRGLQPTRPLCPWGLSRQEYWSRLPCPPPGNLCNPGIEPRSSALQVDSLPTEPPGKLVQLGFFNSVNVGGIGSGETKTTAKRFSGNSQKACPSHPEFYLHLKRFLPSSKGSY